MTDLGQRTLDFLVCLARYTVGLIGFLLVELVNEVLALFVWVANVPSIVIPGLDFDPPTMPVEVLGWINWIFPLQLLAPLFTAVFTAAGVLRVMRWWADRTSTHIEPR